MTVGLAVALFILDVFVVLAWLSLSRIETTLDEIRDRLGGAITVNINRMPPGPPMAYAPAPMEHIPVAPYSSINIRHNKER